MKIEVIETNDELLYWNSCIQKTGKFFLILLQLSKRFSMFDEAKANPTT